MDIARSGREHGASTKPTEGEGSMDLEAWVRRTFKEQRPLLEVVDPTLLGEVHAKKKVLVVFHVALGCTELDPEMRPRMRAVAESLNQRFPIRIFGHRALAFTRHHRR